MRATLNREKLRAVAKFAQFCVRNRALLDDRLIPQTLGIAIRKLHDFGECSRGRGKYLGHPCWSREARKLLEGNSDKVRGIIGKLSHEHVIPVGVVVTELLARPAQTSVREFEELITRLSLVAIVTRTEEIEHLHSIKLQDAPSDRWFDSDPWWRYRKGRLLAKIVDDTGCRIDA